MARFAVGSAAPFSAGDVGDFLEGFAVVEVAVTDTGYGIKRKVIESSDVVVANAATDLLKTARFQPRAEDGVYVEKTIKLRVDLDGARDFRIRAIDG